MRVLLIIYVGVFLLLNFFFDEGLIFFFALTTFPVSLYLLLRKPVPKQKKQSFNLNATGTVSVQQPENRFQNSLGS